ncbi:hypothetical protein LCGC14_2958030 [marine sediment metagenome]|uniref:Uncharacterized protein n=1 Tax=marine sediment metagenome TaxID=412755 RepID=A0A0F8Y0G6_9ZZZZ
MVSEPFFLRMGRTPGAACNVCSVVVDGERYKVASEVSRKGVSIKSGEDFVRPRKPYYVGYWCESCMREEGLLW